MNAKERGILVGQLQIGAGEEICARIVEEGETSSIELQVQQVAGNEHSPPPSQRLRIPVALLPELKLLVQRLEAQVLAQSIQASSPEQEQLRRERGPAFAHPSEAEFARILDFYNIRWQYEPKTFPLQWDTPGKIVESFTPDFYLPEQDLYIELTTRKQSLVTKKNRKVRLLRELYPQVNIKIFYGRDFLRLLQKYATVEEKE